MMNKLFVPAFLLFISCILLTNLNFADDGKTPFIQGFNKVIQRGNFQYHSPHPDISKALLIRARKDEKLIEWQTDRIPTNYSSDYVEFIWYFAISQNAVNNYFNLEINSKTFLKFKNELGSKIGTWEVKGINNSSLTLRATMADKYNDLMGIAILKVQKSDCKLGEPLNIKIIAEDADSYDWYMTFQGKVNEELSIKPTDILVKGINENLHLYKLNIVHLDSEKKIKIITESGFLKEDKIATGFNTFDITIPSSYLNKNVKITISIEGKDTIEKFEKVEPVKEWYVNIVMHSHTDIGYTRTQTEILPEHLRYIDYALDFCDLTDNYPEDSKFRWTCESSWPVKEYLKSRPKSQIEKLKKRVEEGRIELTGMPFNISEIPDESLLASMLKPLNEIKSTGLSVSTAMQDDINGIAWCFIDYFKDINIKYLVMGEHGHRALIPFDYPTVFWWESPAGNKLLAYRAAHYMTGNVIGFHTDNIEFVQKNLVDYLKNLEDKGYPYKQVHLQMSGYVTDNSPPSLAASKIAKEWNEKFEWPKLRIATASTFIKNIEAEYGNNLPTYKAAWPDWWSDGFGSASRETMEERRTQADLISNKGLLSMAAIMGADIPNNILNDISETEEDLAFYTEHTFGADESVREPFTENTIKQWDLKSSYVWDAVKKSKMIKERAMGFIQQYLPKSDYPTIAVFNTLNWQRSGNVKIYIDHQLIPRNKKFKIVDFEGNELKTQSLGGREDGTYWNICVNNVPAMGYNMYKIIVENDIAESNQLEKADQQFENNFYKIVIDKKGGSITSLIDKETNTELVDQNSDWKLGQLIYEELSNRNQLERYTLDDKPERTTLTNVEIKGIKNGPVWNSLFLAGKNEKCCGDKNLNLEIRLYNFEKKIDLIYSIFKEPVISPEGLYVAFPFSLQDSKLIYEAQGGIVEPGKDQIPRTSSDWNVVQNFAAVVNDNSQILLTSNDIPLVQLGGLNVGEFKGIADPDETHIFSWVMNNYWVTNFRASQEGEHIWSYSITSMNNNNNFDKYKFGYENRIPFNARVFPEGKTTNNNFSNSVFNIENKNVILVSASPYGNTKSILLHLKEINGSKTELNFENLFAKNNYRIYESNVLGEKVKENSDIVFTPNEVKFVLVEIVK